MRQQDSDKTNDNGLVSENFTSLLEKDLKQINSVKFNLGEIVKFISSSWSSVSQDTTVQWFSVASSGQSNVMDKIPLYTTQDMGACEETGIC